VTNRSLLYNYEVISAFHPLAVNKTEQAAKVRVRVDTDSEQNVSKISKYQNSANPQHHVAFQRLQCQMFGTQRLLIYFNLTHYGHYT
jgi:hypothetical protein